jgi:2'-5' RNA ligase
MRAKKPRTIKERPPDIYAADTPWRLFIAIPMPVGAQALIASVTADLKRDDPPVRWTADGSAHLTLHFLGEVDPSRAELLRLAFPSFAGAHAAFEIATDGLGCFPDDGPPLVLWLGLAGETRELTAFQRALAVSLRRLAVESEDRAFRPHITLGRIRDEISPEIAMALRALIGDADLNARVRANAAAIPVHHIQLVRSYLERSGPRHEVIAVSNLKRPT